MKRLLLTIVLLAVAAFGVTFTIKNPQDVAVSYYFDIVLEGPLALFLLAAFALGVVFGFLANVALVLRTRRRLRVASRDLERAQSKSQREAPAATQGVLPLKEGV